MNAASPSTLAARGGSDALARKARITFPVSAPKLLPPPVAFLPSPLSTRAPKENRIRFLMPVFFQERVPARHWGINE